MPVFTHTGTLACMHIYTTVQDPEVGIRTRDGKTLKLPSEVHTFCFFLSADANVPMAVPL